MNNDGDKIMIFLQKNILYLSYLFLLFAFSTFVLKIVYLNMNCNDSNSGFQYDFIVVLLILCLSSFKLIFNLLMILQLFHGFNQLNANNISLSKCKLISFFILFCIQFIVEIVYDIDISFFDQNSNNNVYSDIFPAIFLGIDLFIAITLILMFSNKLYLSMKYFDGNYIQSDENEDELRENADVDINIITKQLTQTSVLCIFAIIMRIIYITIVIIDELIYRPSNDNGLNTMYSIREWTTMIAISFQILSIYLLFPFAIKYYQNLCKRCDKCCYIRIQQKQERAMQDYQKL